VNATTAVLLPHHRDELEHGSGIPAEAIAAWGAWSISEPEQLEAAGFARQQWAGPGMLLPVLGPDGRNGLEVYKPDVTPIGADGRPRKYLNPAGAGSRIHFTPAVLAVKDDPTVPIAITEGLKKAVAASAKGLPTLGLLGTWMFKGKNDVGAVTVLADLDAVAWDGREALIVFDSDANRKPGVAMAAERLAVILERRGAKVKIVQLPDQPDGSKTGLDDYLLDHTPADLWEQAKRGRPRTLYAIPYDRERARLEADDADAEIALLLRDRPDLLRHYQRKLAQADRAELYREQVEQSNAALGLVHAVLTDPDKPMAARAAFLTTWFVNRASPDRQWDYQPDLARNAGMKTTDTFRKHVAPFCFDAGPLTKVVSGEWKEDPDAPQGRRYVEHVRYDLRCRDDRETLSSYLRVPFSQKPRKQREPAAPIEPCEHPETVTALAEVDRCTTCDAVLDVRPTRDTNFSGVGHGAPPPDRESGSSPSPGTKQPKVSGVGAEDFPRRATPLEIIEYLQAKFGPDAAHAQESP
jgi:hypothetical protein